MNNRRISRCLLLTLLLPAGVSAQQERIVQGRVLDAQDTRRLPAANVRLLGTYRGTITNSEGAYFLRVPAGEQTIVFSFMGYQPDTLRVPAGGDHVYDARLPRAVVDRETLIVSGNEPARAIIRRAIEAKATQRRGLESYRFDAFTRRVISREDSIAAIMEGYSVGWWMLGKDLREQIIQQRATENMPEVPGLNAVLSIEDFSQDDLQLTGDTFVGPLHPNAFRWYDYTLTAQRMLGDIPVYEIRMEPRSVMIPLLRGTVMIADSSWALVGVDLEPAEMTAIPFIRDFQIRWQQSFTLQGERFWLPSDIRMDGGLKVALGPITIPRIGFRQTAIIYDYELNVAVPDSLYARRETAAVMPEAAKIDSSFWMRNEVLPLTREEERAYAELDSTDTLEEQFAPEGFGMRFGQNEVGLSASRGGGVLGRMLDRLSLDYNRVDGHAVGLHAESDSLFGNPRMELGLMGRRAFSAERWQWEVSLSGIRLLGDRLRVNLYDRTLHAPDAGFYPFAMNMVGTVLTKTDYFDYYRAHGFSLVAGLPGRGGSGTEFRSAIERHTSVPIRTQYSLFDRSTPHRANPAITDGLWHTIAVGGRIGEPESMAGISTGHGLRLGFKGVNPVDAATRAAVGDRHFWVYSGVLSLRTTTWTSRFIFSPYLAIRLAWSWATEGLPRQFWGAPESSYGTYGPIGSLRGLEPRELAGERWWSVNAEHNFRNTPFRLLGLDGLADRGIELLLHGGVAQAWRGGVRLPADGPYYEAGFGIGRLYDLFRLDFTRRLVDPVGWHITLALTTFL